MQRYYSLVPRCSPFQEIHTFSILTTTHRSLFLRSTHINRLPTKCKSPQPRPNNNANNNIPIIIHGQQHHKIRHSKLHHVERRSNHLLKNIRSEWNLNVLAPSLTRRSAIIGTIWGGFARGDGRCSLEGLCPLVLPDYIAVIFFCWAAEEF